MSFIVEICVVKHKVYRHTVVVEIRIKCKLYIQYDEIKNTAKQIQIQKHVSVRTHHKSPKQGKNNTYLI
uniref:Uncharacterized protein n=1 Tax=Arion vulgaris TaxID=1028688 RepID=A0A0B7B8A1_9EUPU